MDTGETVIERDLGARLLMRPPTRNGPVYVVGHGGEREKKHPACLHPETLEEVWRPLVWVAKQMGHSPLAGTSDERLLGAGRLVFLVLLLLAGAALWLTSPGKPG